MSSVIQLSAFGALECFGRGLCPQNPRGIFGQMNKESLYG